MSVIRTFTVTVVGTGSGNKYFINGLQQETVNLAEGYTYRFDQADTSNNNHPLKLSTTSDGTWSGGSQYTTGVTYYGIPGQAGAYTQIIVANPAPQLYYYCQNHSGMGGAANTEPADTWGLLQWGQNSWSNQDIVDVALSGLSTTMSIGDVGAASDTGWGSDSYGVESWGTSGIGVSVTGTSLTTTLGVSDAAGEINSGWGRLEWGTNGWGILGDTELQGQQLSASQGTVSVVAEINSGWGRLEWGNLGWGVPYSALISGTALVSSIGTATSEAETIVTLTGQSLTAVSGNESIGIGINVDVIGTTLNTNIGIAQGDSGVKGSSMSTGIGAVDIQVDGNISINVTEHLMQTAVGDTTIVSATGPSVTTAGLLQTSVGNSIADANTLIDVTGISLTSNIGIISTTIAVELTGISMTASLGSEIAATDVSVLATTFTLNANVGNVDAVSVVDLASLIGYTFAGSVTTEQTANVLLTGISMSTSVGNVAVTPWSEVDLGVNNTWTEVDLAA